MNGVTHKTPTKSGAKLRAPETESTKVKAHAVSNAEWSNVPLETLVDVNRPITYGIVLPGPDIPSGVPYVRVVDMQQGTVRIDHLRRTSSKIAQSYRRSMLSEGDLLVSIRGHVGRTAFVPKAAEGANLTQDTARVAILPSVDRRYVRYYIDSPAARRWMTQHTKGVAVTGINLGDLRKLPVPLRALSEQRRIADILDKADAIRRKRKEAIALTDELLRSTFLDMFGDPVTNPKGWPMVPIEALASAARNAVAIGPFGSNLLSSDYATSGHPVIFVRDLAKGRFVWKSNVFVSAAKFAELAAHHAQPGDVLATKMGDPPGIACVVPDEFPRAVVTADVVKVSVDRAKVFPAYLAAAINSPFGRRQISEITAGVTRAKITLRDFRNVVVRLPPLEQQRRYVDHVAKVARTKEELALGSAEANKLFGSLVACAFSGSLEVVC